MGDDGSPHLKYLRIVPHSNSRFIKAPSLSSAIRSMSSTTTATAAAVQRSKFLVYAPDMTDPDASARRLQVRPRHIEEAKNMESKGMLKLGGAMLTGAEKKMTGSVLIYEAETLEDAKALVYSDVYYTSGVWDKEKMVITPLALAIAPKDF